MNAYISETVIESKAYEGSKHFQNREAASQNTQSDQSNSHTAWTSLQQIIQQLRGVQFSPALLYT